LIDFTQFSGASPRGFNDGFVVTSETNFGKFFPLAEVWPSEVVAQERVVKMSSIKENIVVFMIGWILPINAAK
jgi:hypothetical protein